ncbi:MAG: hypothetical protein WC557_00140 [Ignavibacteriaceae bacterium]
MKIDKPYLLFSSFFFPLVLTLLILLNLGCKKTLTGPEQNIPGRRDYVWTVDTLNYPYNTIIRIWGSSPTDVWAVSPGGDLDKTIFHFDGNRWTTDGISRPISPSAIWGFASDNIFIGGMNGRIWENSGSGWRENAVLTKDGSTQIVFDGMWGDTPNDLFAFGAYPDSNGAANNSVIANYTDNKWTMLNTSNIKGIVEHLYKNKIDGKTYLQAINVGGWAHPDSTVLYEYTNNKFTKIYSGVWDNDFAGDISLVSGEVYFVLGKNIARRVNNEYKTILDLKNTNFYNNIWGRNSKDIFLTMTDGLAHYNGSDIEYLYKFGRQRTYNVGAALFDNELFFLVYEAQTNLNLIYHGVLK